MNMKEVVSKLKEHDLVIKNHESRLKFLEEKFKNIINSLTELKKLSLKAVRNEKIKWIFWGIVIFLLVSIIGK